MEELELTWVRVIKIWWSLIWRGLVYGVLLGIAIGVPLGFVLTALGLEQGRAEGLIQNLSGLGGLLLGIWILKIVLAKSYSDFRIILVPSDEVLLNRIEDSDNSSHE